MQSCKKMFAYALVAFCALVTCLTVVSLASDYPPASIPLGKVFKGDATLLKGISACDSTNHLNKFVLCRAIESIPAHAAVKWTSSADCTVSKATTTSPMMFVGFVDPGLTSAVSSNEWFWVQTKGNAIGLFSKSGSSVTTADYMKLIGGGYVDIQSTTESTVSCTYLNAIKKNAQVVGQADLRSPYTAATATGSTLYIRMK